jgi:uncharacterized membrane protein YhhN
MLLIKKDGIFIFWILLFVHCGLVFMEKTNIANITKLMLVPFLTLHLALNVYNLGSSFIKKIIFTALTASFIGDFLLLFSGNSFFAAGMVSFIVTHVCYAWFFFRAGKFKWNNSTEFVIAASFLGLISFQLLNFMKSYIDYNLLFPMIVYIIAICVMASAASNLFGHKVLRALAVSFFIPGSLLFVLSDSVLAMNKFIYKDDFLNVVVMLSYGYAQCLMVQGFVRYLRV